MAGFGLTQFWLDNGVGLPGMKQTTQGGGVSSPPIGPGITAPKQQQQVTNNQAPAISPRNSSSYAAGLSLPDSREGEPIPYICGTVRIDPNVLWYGNNGSKANATSFTDTDGLVKTTLVYQDTVDIQFGLCTGPGVHLIGLYGENNTAIWTGNVGPGETSFTPTATDGIFSGTCTFYGGEFNQPVNATLAEWASSHAVDMPAFVGTSYLMVVNGGRANNYALSMECQRLPNPLSLSSGVNIASNGKDINLATIVVDFLTTSYNGGGYDITNIDTVSFIATATTLANEGNFGSVSVSSEGVSAGDLIGAVEDQANGIIFINPSTNKVEFRLYRQDGINANDPDLPLIGESNILQTPSYSKGSWDATVKSIKFMFSDRAQGYASTPIQVRTVDVLTSRSREVQTVDMPMVADKVIGTKLAASLLSRKSSPAFALQVVVDRSFADALPTDVVVMTWPPLGFVRVPMHVTGRDTSNKEDNVVTLELIQAIMPNNAVYIPPEENGWQFDDGTALAPIEVKIVDAPMHIVGASYLRSTYWPASSNSDIGAPLCLAVPANQYQDSWTAYYDGSTTSYIGGGASRGSYSVKGELTTVIAANDGISNGILSYDVQVDGCSAFLLTQPMQVGRVYYMLIDDEWFRATLKSFNQSTHRMIFEAVARSRIDTVKAAHAAGAEVWVPMVWTTDLSFVPWLRTDKFHAILLPIYGGVPGTSTITVDFKGLSYIEGLYKESDDKLTETYTPGDKWPRPLRPHNTAIDGVRSGSAVAVARSSSYTISWYVRSRWYFQPNLVVQTNAWNNFLPDYAFADYGMNQDNTPSSTNPFNIPTKEMDPATGSYVRYRVMLKDSAGTEYDLGSTSASDGTSRTLSVTIPSGAATGAGTLWVECYSSVAESEYHDTLAVTIS